MATEPEAASLIEALARVEGKAEIVDGEIVLMPPAGDLHSRSGSAIWMNLRRYERQAPAGRAYGDNVGFLVDLPGRKSFSPDAAYYVGPRSGGDSLRRGRGARSPSRPSPRDRPGSTRASGA
jgi:Uma2 family endonuclease